MRNLGQIQNAGVADKWLALVAEREVQGCFHSVLTQDTGMWQVQDVNSSSQSAILGYAKVESGSQVDQSSE